MDGKKKRMKPRAFPFIVTMNPGLVLGSDQDSSPPHQVLRPHNNNVLPEMLLFEEVVVAFGVALRLGGTVLAFMAADLHSRFRDNRNNRLLLEAHRHPPVNILVVHPSSLLLEVHRDTHRVLSSTPIRRLSF
jgi:hypothetical protein